jgi:hypothetical protein
MRGLIKKITHQAFVRINYFEEFLTKIIKVKDILKNMFNHHVLNDFFLQQVNEIYLKSSDFERHLDIRKMIGHK